MCAQAAARIVLQDWNDGRIPYYTVPPQRASEVEGSAALVQQWGAEFNANEVGWGTAGSARCFELGWAELVGCCWVHRERVAGLLGAGAMGCWEGGHTQVPLHWGNVACYVARRGRLLHQSTYSTGG